MTRKDYKLIAWGFSMARPLPDVVESRLRSRLVVRLKQWNLDREKIADILASDNYKFDRDKFFTATEET
jgi:hypothetical protein